MRSGTPRRMKRSDSKSMTSEDVSFWLILIDRHSRVNSSTTVSMRHLRPSWVGSFTRSQGRTWLNRSARSRTEDPVARPDPAAFRLPPPGGDLLRRVLLPWQGLILPDAARHASSRITSGRWISVKSGFGAAGTLVALLLRVPNSAQIFLFGADLTRSYAKHLGSVSSQRRLVCASLTRLSTVSRRSALVSDGTSAGSLERTVASTDLTGVLPPALTSYARSHQASR